MVRFIIKENKQAGIRWIAGVERDTEMSENKTNQPSAPISDKQNNLEEEMCRVAKQLCEMGCDKETILNQVQLAIDEYEEQTRREKSLHERIEKITHDFTQCEVFHPDNGLVDIQGTQYGRYYCFEYPEYQDSVIATTDPRQAAYLFILTQWESYTVIAAQGSNEAIDRYHDAHDKYEDHANRDSFLLNEQVKRNQA